MSLIPRLTRTLVPERYRGALRALRYSGDRVACPCCGGHFSGFLPYGVVRREGALCPRCDSLERHRLLYLYLRDRSPLFSERFRVLHIAPEPVFEKLLRALPNLDYLSADLRSPRAMVRMDICQIAYGDESFDFILANHVLEHVPDDKRAMRELRRVLSRKGFAILQAPIDTGRAETFEDPSVTSPEERERLFGNYDHVRMYGRDYADRLREAGFTVKVEPYAKELGPELSTRYGLMADEEIYVCTL
jgi:SAM-dependent methyltransferase